MIKKTLFDDLMDKVNDVAQVANKKVGEAYSATKLKIAISEKQGELKGLFRELGEIAYKSFKESESNTEAFEDKVAEIDLVRDAIDELNGQMKQVKDFVICPSCNEAIEASANFCPKCGAETVK